MLNELYKKSASPRKKAITEVALILNCCERWVKDWLMNKRGREKRKAKRSEKVGSEVSGVLSMNVTSNNAEEPFSESQVKQRPVGARPSAALGAPLPSAEQGLQPLLHFLLGGTDITDSEIETDAVPVPVPVSVSFSFPAIVDPTKACDLLFVKKEIPDDDDDLLGRKHRIDNQASLRCRVNDIKKEFNDTNAKKRKRSKNKSHTYFSDIINHQFDRKTKKND